MQSDNVAVFKNTTTGQLVERPYGHFYSLMPTTTHPVLADAGLADSTGYLNVDPTTLQHKTYDNIFGLGDVNNVPTTKSFYGGLSQVAVLRHNIERKLNGLSLNAKYDGYAKVSLYTSPHSIANVEHKYGGEEVSFSTDGFASSLRHKLYSMTGKHNHENILKFKNWGPPNYKFKKSFTGGEGVPAAAAPAELVPEKKTA
jgi:sulfide:quinone oxidoreductase